MIRHTRGERRLRSGPPRAARRSPGRCCQSTRGRFQAQCAHDKEVRSNACAIRRSPDARPSRTTTRVIAIDFWSDYLPWALSCRTQTSIERPPTSQDKASTSHDLAAPRRHFYPSPYRPLGERPSAIAQCRRQPQTRTRVPGLLCRRPLAAPLPQPRQM